MDRDTLHPSEKDLLLFVDGELGKRQSGRIERHLVSCWDCRARLAEIEDTINQFVRLRRKLLDSRLHSPSLPSEHVSRAQLENRLAQADGEKRLGGWWRWLAVRPAWSVGPLLALLLIAVLIAPLLVPRLSAMEVIANGRAAELRRPAGAVIHQRVRIHTRQTSSGAASLEYDLWKRPGASRMLLTAGRPDPAERLRNFYLSRGADWESPLSVTSFARLRESLGPVRDEVRGGEQITVTCTPQAAGDVMRLALTVRRSDWHAVSQRIELREAEYELSEVLDEAVPREKLDPAIFTEQPRLVSKAPSLRALTRSVPQPVAQPSGPSRQELDDAEVRLREGLHQTWADVEEVPEIWREGDQVRFRLFTQTQQRKEEILTALNGIPHLAGEVSDAEALDAEHPAVGTPSSPVPALYSTVPPLAKALREYSGGLDPANTYLETVRDSYLQVLVEGSALARLAERYTEAEWDRLSPESQQRLNRIAADHIAAVRTNLRNYLRLVSPVLDEMVNREHLDQPAKTEPNASGCTPWQTAAQPLVADLKSLETSFQRLFVEDRLDHPVTFSAPELLGQSLEMRARLQQHQICQP